MEYRVHGTAKMLAAGLVLKSVTACRIFIDDGYGEVMKY